ncbi:tetratricopeptide repeat protein [Parasediminibacterium paludis]|uniref:Tetratricopeptide repeat protein n=1 Tax=Parasediminibacterium paludis TaxID=908966 RepID=A0ABV8PXD8_9BACT
MQPIKLVIFCFFITLATHATAQSPFTYEEANTKSYALYEKASWKELLDYGREAVLNNQDFTLLRLRMGYAAFMLNNFSEAIRQYEQVLKNDSYNSTAHYYIWLCRKYLNQTELADAQVRYLSPEVIAEAKLRSFAFTDANIEASFKTTNSSFRNNTNYEKIELKNRFGYNIHMQQAGALFNQSILLANALRPGAIPPPPPYRTASINQSEYYNKITANMNSHWQLKAAYHYTQTNTDNTIYNNQSALVGIKYFNHYFDIQADAIFSTITDTSISQYNAQIGIYPFGNLKLYGFSTAIIRNRPSGSAFNFRQVIGVQISKKLWLEGNTTLGTFTDLLENDGLYIYNQIDKNLFKAGLFGYIPLSSQCTFNMGYTLEQRVLYNTNNTFNQHSITGGLSWKF